MKNIDENKIHTDEKEKHTKTKITICIIIIIIIILLLLTSCTSGFWGKIGSIIGNSTHVVDPTKPSEKEYINKDLRFDVAENSITLDESSYKLTYSTKNILAKDVTCSTSDANIATCVAYDGYVVVNPKKAGTVIIYATTRTNGAKYTATSELTIKDGNNGIRLSSRSGTIVLSKSNTKNVAYNLIGIKGKVNVSVDNKDVVTATASDGVLKIKGLKPGNAVITLNVEYGGKYYTVDYRVTVVKTSTSTATKPTATKKPTTNKVPLKLNTASKELRVKEKYQIDVLSGTVKSWKSSDTSVAIVSKTGLVTAKKAGTVTITATDKDGNKAIVTIYVTEMLQSSALVLSATNKTLKVGETYTPAVIKGTASSWTSSDSSIATVDKNGKIVAKKPGIVTITAKDKKGNKTSIIITVTETVKPTTPTNPTNPTSPSKDGIVLEGANTTKVLEIGQKENIKVKQGTAVKWESSNSSIVSVDNNGNITAISSGTVLITATDAKGNKSSITITVKPSTPIVDNLELSAYNVELYVGNTFEIRVTNGQALTWESNNSAIATVDQSGIIVAKAEGTAIITVTGANGEKKTVTVVVKKKESPVNPTDRVILNDEGTTKQITVGDNITLGVKQGTPNKWESSNSDVVTVDNNGNIIGKKPGTAIITVTDKDGNKSSVTVEVKAKTIELSRTEINLIIGEKASVTTINGTGPVKEWQVDPDSKNIVKVNPTTGEIEAIGEGQAKVYAVNESGEKTVLIVNVSKSNNNRLASLKVDASGDVLVNDSGVDIKSTYELDIDSADKNILTIVAKAEDDNVSKLEYIYNGVSTVNDAGFTLDVTNGGTYVVTVKVTAQNGAENSYEIIVNKPKSNNTGITLKYDDKALSSQDTNLVRYNATNIGLTYKLDDSRSKVTKVTINGEPTDLNNISLNPNEDNELVVTVTAEDGTTEEHTYILRRAALSLELKGNDNFTFNINDAPYRFEYRVVEEGGEDITATVDIKDINISKSTFTGSIKVIEKGIIEVKPNIQDVGIHKVNVSYKDASNEIDLIVRDSDYYLTSPKNKYDAYFNSNEEIVTSAAIYTDILRYNEKGPLYTIKEQDGMIIVKSTAGDNGILEIKYDKSQADIGFVKNADVSNSYILQIKPKAGATNFDIDVSGSIHGKLVDNLSININVISKYILMLDAGEGYLDSLRNQTYTVLLESGEEFDLTGFKPYKVADTEKCEIYPFVSWMLGNNEYKDSNGDPIQIVKIVNSDIKLTVKYSTESQEDEETKTGYLDLQDLDLFNSINNQYDIKKLIYPGLEGGHGITIENNSDSKITITKLIIQEQNLCIEQGQCLNMGYAIRRNNPNGVNNTYYYGRTNDEAYAILNRDSLVGTSEDNYYDAGSSITHIEIPVDDPEFVIEAHSAVELGVLWKWVEIDHDLDTQIGELANVNNKYKFWLSIEYESTVPYCKLSN